MPDKKKSKDDPKKDAKKLKTDQVKICYENIYRKKCINIIYSMNYKF